VDISLLLKSKDEEEEARSTTSAPASSRSASVPTTAVASTTAESTPISAAATVPTKRQQGTPHPSESPAKKQSKWSPEEDEKIIRLRGDAMKWEDISKQLPGRSAISCRLHYQNYLERRSEWDEDRKNKLARLYERYVE
jgi:Myb-like DNA-binding domain